MSPMTLKERSNSTEDSTETASILIIDDDESTRIILGAILKDVGYKIETADDGDVGIKKFLQKQPDLIITDMLMPRMPGMNVIADIKENFPQARIIAITGASTNAQGIKKFGIDEILQKPIHRDTLLQAVKKSLP
ncbi:MAG: response regulator [Planctomycetes bacterium]|nr:response regulator [Planctomycetota bacterium]